MSTEIQFKDVYQHYLGCLISDREYPEEGVFEMDLPMLNEYIKQHEEHLTPMEHFTDYFKPLLYPLSVMTDEQAKEFGCENEAEFYCEYIDGNDGICAIKPTAFIKLIKMHFNVFNLPESEYIDCTTLPENPYSKP